MKFLRKEEKSSRYKHIAILTAIALAVATTVLVFAFAGVGLPCVFYEITGLYCPGCGNTRAAMAIVKLNFSEAFSYNAIFLIEYLYIIYVYVFCCLNYLKNKKFSYQSPAIALDITVLAVVVLWGVVRNILHI
ncbi:MAG: DUF2752 domain-containing protein [Clostridia bacterium]|nr:DUF2752 domain-containing protein [Clostridia bacterium]